MVQKRRYYFMLLIFVVLITGCTTLNNDESLHNKIDALEKDNERLQEELDEATVKDDQSLLERSLDIMQLIKDKDWEDLAEFVHPDKGVRLTPYIYIDTDEDVVLSQDEIKELSDNQTEYTWGSFDGSGTPIELTFSKYYEEFIYDEDFLNPHIIGNDQAIQIGNAIDNTKEVYPEAKFIEFHFTGFDEQYGGIDWRSLRLVLEEENNEWLLVGIIHGENTI